MVQQVSEGGRVAPSEPVADETPIRWSEPHLPGTHGHLDKHENMKNARPGQMEFRLPLSKGNPPVGTLEQTVKEALSSPPEQEQPTSV